MVVGEIDSRRDKVMQATASYLERQMGYRNAVVSETTDFGKDFGMDGDDARDFLIWFENEFCVALNGLRFDDYFGSEGAFFPLPWAWLIPRKKKKSLTMSMLLQLLQSENRTGLK